MTSGLRGCGGGVLFIEAASMAGKGGLALTGNWAMS
jgi:ATP-dependent Lon protease